MATSTFGGSGAKREASCNHKSLRESRVAVIGGSIGGCAAAISLRNAGIQSIDVFERSSSTELSDRGLGIGLPGPVFQQLVNHDMIDPGMRFVSTQKRQWILNDGTFHGRVLHAPEMKVQLHNWGLLWQQLRKRVDDSHYHSGTSVDLKKTVIHRDEDGAKNVELFSSNNGSSLGRYDFCIQADGAISDTTNHHLAKYAGYVLWRGSFSVHEHPHIDLTGMPETFFTPVFLNGHGIIYMMPSAQNEVDHLINFAIYTHTPPKLQEFTKVTRASDITLEQHAFFEETAMVNMPPRFQEMVDICRQNNTISFHPILDRVPNSFVTLDGMGLLLGDAGAVLRPHTAAGTTKAIMEALFLQELLSSETTSSWQDVTKAYELNRRADAETKVNLGERLGDAQVLNTPEWSSMEASDFEDWLAAQVAGSGHYMYKHLKNKK
jgi:2-polyprenyl-6-methoxyphenol hydroxylase-like FAD-dependent oxidoreductase